MSQEPVIFNPWNSKAKLISVEEVELILNNHDIPEKIKNLRLYQQAFVHKSYVSKCLEQAKQYENTIMEKPADCLDLQQASYERLEYLGDAILSATIASYLFERFPEQDEGFLTRMRTKLVNGEMLGSLGQKMELEIDVPIWWMYLAFPTGFLILILFSTQMFLEEILNLKELKLKAD